MIKEKQFFGYNNKEEMVKRLGEDNYNLIMKTGIVTKKDNGIIRVEIGNYVFAY